MGRKHVAPDATGYQGRALGWAFAGQLKEMSASKQTASPRLSWASDVQMR